VATYPYSITNGIVNVTLKEWQDFTGFVNNSFLDLPFYIWRGHRCSSWRLEPTLTRLLKGAPDIENQKRTHLENFRFAIRGRRGPYPSELGDDELWAIGQHSFLASPLLDWSMSPYVALFFAFADDDDAQPTEERVVFGLNEMRVKEKQKELKDDPLTPPFPWEDFINFLRPLTDENSRLVNQAGLFTSTSGSLEIEEWVRSKFEGVKDKCTLARIKIPNKGREECLKSLNKMNINYSTLFPDLYGASRHCNLKLKIKNY
jgi:FRG domain